MATVLENVKLIPLEEFPEECAENNSQKDIRYSSWVKTDEVYSPITNSVLLEKLDPGLYVVDKIQNNLICKKQKLNSDNLIRFNESLFDSLTKDIKTFWGLKDKFKENDLVHKRGFLLEGPPGNGKSSLISLLINDLIQEKGIAFKISNVNSFYETIDFVNDIFRKIEPETPIIFIIEDVDLIYKYIAPELLDFLDGKFSVNHSISILTTNDSTTLNSALIRPSRIDRIYLMDTPNESVRTQFFKTKNIKDSDLKDLVTNSEGFTFAQMKELYISIYLLGNSLKDSIKILNTSFEGTNYLNDNSKNEFIL